MKSCVLYVPGLNDDKFLNRFVSHLLPFLWKPFDLYVYIFRPNWRSGNLQAKLKKMKTLIYQLSGEHKEIFLLGQSAGGSLVLNVFAQNKTKIAGVVNIGGILAKGTYGFPLSAAAKNSAAFKESVLTFENKNTKKLTDEERRRILIVRPLFDEIVPRSTCALKGARIQTIPTVEHTVSGIAACTIFSPIIFRFFKSLS